MSVKVAYGPEGNIEGAVASGKIPPGAFIITKGDGELYFYDTSGELQSIVSKDWIKTLRACMDDAERLSVNIEKSSEEAKKASDSASLSAKAAKQYSGNPPLIQNDTWWIWNAAAGQYQDTGSVAVVKSPYQIAVEEGYTGTEADFYALLAALGDLNSALDAINGEVI